MKKLTEERQLPYNTEKKKLVIPEYGRHIHSMIDYAKTIEDKNERNKVAKSIISVMGNFSPHLRDVPDFQHKLWDQFFIISDFDIDIDSPYKKVSKAFFEKRPDPLNYPHFQPKYRFYGNNITNMINEIDGIEDVEGKKKLILILANLMKKFYIAWNRGTVKDTVILGHLQELSKTKIAAELLPKELIPSEQLLTQKYNKNGNLGRKNIKKKKPKKRTPYSSDRDTFKT